MNRATLALISAVALSGCVSESTPVQPSRYYINYRAVLMEQVDHAFMGGPNASVPGPVKLAYAECGADYVLSGFTENERARLDAFARRVTPLTAGELRDLDARVRSRLGGDLTVASLDRLNGTCPDKVPLFKRYLRQN